MFLSELNLGKSSSYQIYVHFYSFCDNIVLCYGFLGCNIPSFRAELFQDV